MAGIITYPPSNIGPATIQGSLTVEGDLTVQGQTTTVDDIFTTDVVVEDSNGTEQFHIDGNAGTPNADYHDNELQQVGAIRSGSAGDPSLTPGSPFVLGGADMRFSAITGTPTFGGHDHTSGGMTAVPNAGLANDTITVNGLDGLGGGSAALGNSLTIGVTGDLDLDNDLLATNGEVIWDESNTHIPQGRLENDSITLNGGDGLKNGSTAALGGSFSLDIEPADFAGNALEDDGSDNLAVSSGAIGTGELNTPFTDLSTLVGSPASVGATDLRLDTGQAIEDGGGNKRAKLFSYATNLYAEDGSSRGISLDSDDYMRYDAYSTAPWQILDNEQGATAVQYDTGVSSGTLRTPNAGVRVEHSNDISTGEGMQLQYANDTATINTRDYAASTYRPLELQASLVDLTATSPNLRIATGQAIEDGGGDDRFAIGNTGGSYTNQSGDTALVAYGSGEVKQIDNNGGVGTSLYSGRFEIHSGHDLRLATGQAIEDGSGVSRIELNSGGTHILDQNGTKYADFGSGAIRFDNASVDLRLATGQAIEDGSGTERYNLLSTATQISDENGNVTFSANAGSARLKFGGSDGTSQRLLTDTVGNFGAIKYIVSSSAPGTLELTNADLDAGGNDITDLGRVSFSDRDNDGYNWEVVENSGNGHLQWVSDGGGGNQMDLEHNGDLRIEGTLTESAAL